MAPMGKGTISPERSGRLLSGRWLYAVSAGAVAAGLFAACGSSPGSAQASSRPKVGTCQQLSGVLSNGPDPDADAVGYALAQVLPLQRFKAPGDAPLQTAVDHLSSAYQEFYQDNGKGQAAKSAVAQAIKQVNVVCPGAAS
jgi:hypothetical protein